ncbi:MAG: glycosyltransferase family 4 protein [Candidatus Promineifilaceae bacterium]
MRLVYLLLSPTFGMHQYTADLANRLVEKNDVFLVTTVDYPRDRYSPAISVRTPLVTSDTGLSLKSFRNIRLAAVMRALEDLQPDVVHITGPYLWNVLIVWRLRRRGIPVIHTLHDLDPHKGVGYGKLLHIWNRLITQSADKILVHGEVYRQRLILKGLSADSVVSTPLLHLFVGFTNQLAARDAALEVSFDNKILFFGRIEEYKGVEVLIEAYRLLRSQLDPERIPPVLVLAGTGTLRDGWTAQLPPGIEWRDHFINDCEALELFSACSLVVLPYVDGTQSAIIASAYYFKKPVITTNVGAFPEYVDQGKTGLIVDPGDPEAICGAFIKMFADESILRTMGSAGRQWYDNQREMEIISLINLYG